MYQRHVDFLHLQICKLKTLANMPNFWHNYRLSTTIMPGGNIHSPPQEGRWNSRAGHWRRNKRNHEVDLSAEDKQEFSYTAQAQLSKM